MKVFISWSGHRSQAVATALRELIPDALQDVDVWMSAHEIAAGTRWSSELGGALEGSGFGILCLTPENFRAPWLLFEAGSLAKSVATARVVPYLLDLSPADLELPLAQFQNAVATKEGTFKLLQALNQALPSPLSTERIQRIFERWWPELSARLNDVPSADAVVAVRRNERELLEEILELVRRERLAVGWPADAVHSSMVWRQIHDLSNAEIKAMPPETLKRYLVALKNRWNATNSRGEEDALEGRMAQVELELQARTDTTPEPPGLE